MAAVILHVVSLQDKQEGFFFYGNHPDVFALGNINNESSRQTQLVYYYYSGNMFRPYWVIIRPSL